MPFLTAPAYRKRPDTSRWQVIWYEVDGARKTRRFKSGFVTRTQAARWWADFTAQHDAGAIRHDSTTLAEFLPRYIAWAATTQRPASAWLETRTLTLFAAHAGTRPVADITTAQVEAFLASRAAVVTASTTNRDLVYLRKLFNVARRWGIVAANPTEGVPKRRVAERPVVYLTDTEQRELVRVALARSSGPESASPHLYPLVALGLRTGLRRAELLNLRWGDIADGLVTVTNSPTHKTKSGRVRVVALDGDAHAAIEWWREWIESAPLPDALRDVIAPRPDRYVFPSMVTAALRGRNVPLAEPKRAFSGLVRAALPGRHVTLHHLRHTFAVNCARAGVPLPLLSQLMGHASYSTTQIYLRFSRDAGARAALAAVPSLCAIAVPREGGGDQPPR